MRSKRSAPNSFQNLSSHQGYQDLVAKTHQAIDHLFDTHQSERFTEEAKAYDSLRDFTICELPPPGKLAGGKTGVLEKTNPKPLTDAYINAMNGGKHSGLIETYNKKTPKELRKSIKSYEKQIAKHEEKIVNPEKHCKEWDRMPEKKKKNLIREKWPAEIEGFKEQKDIMQSILDQMEGH